MSRRIGNGIMQKKIEIDKIKDELDKKYAMIETSKQQLSYQQGQLDSKMRELKEKFGIDNLEEARKELNDLEAHLSKLEKKINTQYEKIRKELYE